MSVFLVQGALKTLENHLILGHLPENFHLTSFSQCSHNSPQLSSFHFENPVFWLWKCTEYTFIHSTCRCLLPFWRPAVVCSRDDQHLYTQPIWGAAPLRSMKSACNSKVHCGSGWALSSQSPMFTPLEEDVQKFRWFGGIKEAFDMPLMTQETHLPSSSL